jgi:hypothetical protein
VIADENGRADALWVGLVLVMPKAMRRGNIAATAGLAGYSGATIPREGDDDAFGGDHGGGIDLVAKSVADPEFLARLGVEGLKSFEWSVAAWQTDSALASVREPAALAKLPDAERARGSDSGLTLQRLSPPTPCFRARRSPHARTGPRPPTLTHGS